MKKRLNTVFFSLCFLSSVIAEAYFIQAGAGNLFSIIALGIVVLITAYLCMDSIRSNLSESAKEIRHYIDQMYREETQSWNDRFNELHNLQKATYTATKKNTATIAEQLEELLDRVEVLEGNNTKTLQKLIELQKKALEGQKNSLGLEINYNKENTKQLIKAISETGNQTETLELLNKIIVQLDHSTQLIQNELQSMNVTVQIPSGENQSNENKWNRNPEVKVENLTETGWDVDAEVELVDATGDWNNNTDSIIEELDSGWEMNGEQTLNTDWSTDTLQEELVPEWSGFADQDTEKATENSWVGESISEDDATVGIAWDSIDDDLNNLIQGLGIESADEKTPEFIPSEEEEIKPEVVETVEEPEPQKQDIKPLYDDPNKALTADEIAALFASFGQ